MKKALIVLLILSLSLVLVACGTAKTELDMLKDKVSYEEHCMAIAENETYRVEVMGVKGESVPTIDNKVGDTSDRFIVKLTLASLDKVKDEYVVTMSSGNNKASITLKKDVLGMSYSASVMNDVMAFKPTDVTIMNDDKGVALKFSDPLSKASIDSTKAIEVAYNDLKESMTDDFDGGKYNGEVVIKLIHNRRVSDSPYYYYVSFMKSNDSYVSCLIDPTTGKVVNKKIK